MNYVNTIRLIRKFEIERVRMLGMFMKQMPDIRSKRLAYRQRMAARAARAAKIHRGGDKVTPGPLLQGGVFHTITPWFTDEKDGLPTRLVGDIESAPNAP